MNILLTNDDGIHSEGLNSLYNAFSTRHDVYVIAPEKEQSACSNAITVRTELNIKKIADNRFSVSGFPADCVIIGLSGELIPEADLVISGINHGPNVGDDMFFSGTVAGARTAYIFGKAAIAISINSYHKASRYADDASIFLLNFIDDILPETGGASFLQGNNGADTGRARQFLNINYPDLPPEKIRGIKYTYAGRRFYRDSFKKTKFESDQATVQMGGYIESVSAEGSDTTELENGFISVTPLMIDSTDYSYLKKLAEGTRNG
jgi:5'-nucleotidase